MLEHVAYLVLERAAGATLTPEHAISILNVLPHHQSVLTTVLSRGFCEFSPALAIKHGHGLALLPHYPFHVLSIKFDETLEAAGACGHLPTIDLLWQLTVTTMEWFSDYGFINEAIKNDHVAILEWASRADTLIDWPSHFWHLAAEAGHTRVLNWAIAHGYLEELDCSAALLSTRKGDPSVIQWWIASQPRKVIDASALIKATRECALKALGWWWAYTGSAKLPDPQCMTLIANAALSGHSLKKVIEWWWTRFLERRTPEHTFGGMLEIGEFTNLENLDWYNKHFHQSPEYFARPREEASHGLIFTIGSLSSLSILEWAVEKCAVLDGQKLKLNSNFFHTCASQGRIAMLDFALQHHLIDALVVNQSANLVLNAIHHNQLKVLEWWDRNRDQLPPQNLNCSVDLARAALLDGMDVIAWWHARFPVSSDTWKQVCITAATHNARHVQLWLLDRPNLYAPESVEEKSAFMIECLTAMLWPTPFTLDFIGAMFPALPSIRSPLPWEMYACSTRLLWYCSRFGISFDSLLPVDPSILASLLESKNVPMLEWWLQAHLAAGHRFVLPESEEIGYYCQVSDRVAAWVRDVIVIRKIPMYVQSESGVVLYQLI
ncbi:hypothetical protein BC828DRAFT_15359 [Blastocladiella britannica]|nr:hypothetical protein BC828DRAFT_15359 [Blastocladiella britannica]